MVALAYNVLQIGDVADLRSRKLSVSTKFELKKQNLILTENPAILPMCCYR